MILIFQRKCLVYWLHLYTVTVFQSHVGKRIFLIGSHVSRQDIKSMWGIINLFYSVNRFNFQFNIFILTEMFFFKKYIFYFEILLWIQFCIITNLTLTLTLLFLFVQEPKKRRSCTRWWRRGWSTPSRAPAVRATWQSAAATLGGRAARQRRAGTGAAAPTTSSTEPGSAGSSSTTPQKTCRRLEEDTRCWPWTSTTARPDDRSHTYFLQGFHIKSLPHNM